MKLRQNIIKEASDEKYKVAMWMRPWLSSYLIYQDNGQSIYLPIFPLFTFFERKCYLMLNFGYSSLMLIFYHLWHEIPCIAQTNTPVKVQEF